MTDFGAQVRAAPPMTPIEAAVDCRECGARAGESHADGCDVYALYAEDT